MAIMTTANIKESLDPPLPGATAKMLSLTPPTSMVMAVALFAMKRFLSECEVMAQG